MKILRAGARSIYDDSQWIPGVWREEPTALQDGKPCGVGLHSLLGDEPRCSPVFRFPIEVWRDECECECGRDSTKARFRRQRVVENITDRFPNLIAVNRFITETIPAVRWLEPELTKTGKPRQRCWMRVERHDIGVVISDAAWAATGYAAWAATGYAVWDATPVVSWNVVWHEVGDAVNDAVRAATGHAVWSAAGNAVKVAKGKAHALLVGDLDVDTTWLHRWWEAWAMGFYPIREDGDRLVVGWITKE